MVILFIRLSRAVLVLNCFDNYITLFRLPFHNTEQTNYYNRDHLQIYFYQKYINKSIN